MTELMLELYLFGATGFCLLGITVLPLALFTVMRLAASSEFGGVTVFGRFMLKSILYCMALGAMLSGGLFCILLIRLALTALRS